MRTVKKIIKKSKAQRKEEETHYEVTTIKTEKDGRLNVKTELIKNNPALKMIDPNLTQSQTMLVTALSNTGPNSEAENLDLSNLDATILNSTSGFNITDLNKSIRNNRIYSRLLNSTQTKEAHSFNMT